MVLTASVKEVKPNVLSELVVRAGHTNAESAKLWVSNRLVTFWAAGVFITTRIGIVHYHSCSHFWFCLLFVIATLSILN